MSTNPFPGPVPYRAEDRARFFGRTDMAHKLRASILASRCMTVHGPSGAGKSSIMQAAVLPMLAEKSAARILRVDAWPEGEDPTKWLAEAMATLGLGGPSADETAHETVLRIAQGAARASSRPLVIYLDQLEQLLFAHRSIEETQPFFDCVEELVDTPWRTVRVVLSLREDYLGKFRDRLRDFRRITEGGFRVGPLNVAELTDAVVQAAALGEPAQEWSVQEMRDLMMQVRFPGQAATEEAEAQSAYAQIICRALFQERAAGKTIDATEAEPILRGYLESTVAGLGGLRKQAELFLEDHLVGADGSRTLRTEKELARVVDTKDLGVILKQLEGAAILRAEEHHGSRYFEIGHDWLARRVFEQRQTREQALALEREREKSRTQRRLYATIAGISLAIATAGVTLGLYANQKRAAAERAENEARMAEAHAKAAEQKADEKAKLAQEQARQALNAGLVAAARDRAADPTLVLALVREMEPAAQFPPKWRVLALGAKVHGVASVVIHQPDMVRMASFSPDGKRIVTACWAKSVRVWNADGTGKPVVLEGHQDDVYSAAFSPDGQRIVTASKDKTVRIWNAEGTGKPLILEGHKAGVAMAAFSPDGTRIVTASQDKTARVWNADGTGKPLVFEGHQSTVYSAAFSPNGQRIVTASHDKTARVWNAEGNSKPVVLEGHKSLVISAGFSPDGKRIVTASYDKTARVWNVEGNSKPLVLEGHPAALCSAAFSPDGRHIVTTSADKTVRVWSFDVASMPLDL
ncbi:MAG TPA: WD40 repeat domain-containing protein, partial [Polyangium sp.]|nr:WD40 repeat domain-containing protein [Polyangium sp.]